jgi:hypothetical protein
MGVYGISTKESSSPELPGCVVNVHPANKACAESAALVRPWLVRETRHIGALCGNKRNKLGVTPRAARPV